MTTTFMPRGGHSWRLAQMRRLLTAVVLAAGVGACSANDLTNVENPNDATVAGATADPTALQLLFTGLFSGVRGQRTNMIQQSAVFGREGYVLSPQDGRFATLPLIGVVINGVQKIDQASGFTNNPWDGQYGVMRDLYNFKNAVNGNGNLSAAQKAGVIGIAQTFESLMMFDIVQSHDSLGGITEIKDDATQPAPFVSRDSMYKFIIGSLDQAITNLNSAGTKFAFTLPPGFAAFNTPATFAKFAQAMKAKAEVHYATLGGGNAAWQAALSALNASFLNASAVTRAELDAGAYDTYGVAPDTPNGLSSATNTNLYGHMSLKRDVQLKADGTTPDDRYTAKVRTGIPPRAGPVANGSPTTETTTIGFSIWPAQNSSIPIIRNEELILLRAEARLATGDKAGAITDLNTVRVNSGGLPPSSLTAASSNDAILEGILYEKRYSLLMEGDRWPDMRRYKKLNELPLDVASGPNKNFVAIVNPIPQSECLVRVGLSGEFLGPNGLNNCEP
jgi:hypothetical protein